MLNVYRAYVGDKMSFDIKEEHGILSAEVIDEDTNLPPYLFIDGSLKAPPAQRNFRQRAGTD